MPEYVERPDYDPGIRLVDAADNTVMTRTFSKIFGLGGMRIGWAYAPPAVIDVLNRVRAPFNVSIAAQAAVDDALPWFCSSTGSVLCHLLVPLRVATGGKAT